MNRSVLLEPVCTSTSNTRLAFVLDDGAVVESVLYRGHTLCVSSQVGCAVGCPFCASGQNGLARNLTLDEMAGQVKQARTSAPGLRRVAIAGVGEPLHNFAVLDAFVRWCRDENLAPSVTTSGGSPRRLRRLFELPHNGVTLSVHAGTEPVRRRMVPHAPSLEAMFGELRRIVPGLSRSRRRRVSLGYLLLRDVNDMESETAVFAEQARELGISVYLYRLNPVPGAGFLPSPRYDEVRETWQRWGLEVRRSSSARVDDNGGCGTLMAFAQR